MLLSGCGRLATAAVEPRSGADAPAAVMAVPDPDATPSPAGAQAPASAGAQKLSSQVHPTSCNQTRSVPDLLGLGQDALGGAIALINQSPRYDALSKKIYYDDSLTYGFLRDARDCYTKTLQSSPNNYTALLGLGIANTMGAMIETEDQQLKASYVQSAKRLLGRAYVVRQGPYEPIYYMAQVAMIEGQNDKATEFLNLLLKAGYKVGSVYALYAEISARVNNDSQAEEYYRKVLEVGASAAELRWAVIRLASLRAKRKK